MTRTREEALSMIQVRHAILKIVFWHMMLACLGRVASSLLRYHYTPLLHVHHKGSLTGSQATRALKGQQNNR